LILDKLNQEKEEIYKDDISSGIEKIEKTYRTLFNK
jgi:hypothetical protein